jgi:hypothetical protein
MYEPLPLELTRTDTTALSIRMNATHIGWEQWFLLSSDRHHDNQHCNQKLEKEHLDEARARRAGILDFGDLYCVMQGKWDKRADPSQLREELRGGNYLDDVVEYNAEFYRPYAPNFLVVSPGNHETAFTNRHETDLTRSLVRDLRANGSMAQANTYQGWVKFQFNFCTTHRQSFNLRYTHGYAGGGPVTKDAIQANRQMVFLDGVDFLVSGHTHDAWHLTYRREILHPNGRTYLRDVECLKCPGYKDEYSCGGGWAVGKGHPPKPLGAWWLRFFLADSVIKYEIHRAK